MNRYSEMMYWTWQRWDSSY